MKDFDDRSKVGQWIFAAKALFQLRKQFKNIDMKNLSLDNIQKIWVLLGAIIGQFAGGWMPEFIIQLFGPEGTDIFFKLIGAAISLWQFLDIRTGKKEAELNAQVSGAGKAPQALKAESNKLYYALWPFAKAA